ESLLSTFVPDGVVYEVLPCPTDEIEILSFLYHFDVHFESSSTTQVHSSGRLSSRKPLNTGEINRPVGSLSNALILTTLCRYLLGFSDMSFRNSSVMPLKLPTSTNLPFRYWPIRTPPIQLLA